MRFSYTGKNINVKDSLKERAAQKIGRLERLLPEDAEVFIAFSSTKGDNKIEVTIPLHKRILRAEVTDLDMNAAIDASVDVLEKQIVKYKSRLRNRRKEPSFSAEYNAVFTDSSPVDENEIVIKKTKRFALKPMDAEEAVMEMEMLGHDFYMFRNSTNDEVNVVYRRREGTYGLIEPEY